MMPRDNVPILELPHIVKGGGGGITLGCVAVCSRRRLLASRHLLAYPFDPFPP